MIIEGHNVETASQMVDAILSGGGGVPGFNGCPLRQKANVAQVLRSVITSRDETAKHMSSSSESSHLNK